MVNIMEKATVLTILSGEQAKDSVEMQRHGSVTFKKKKSDKETLQFLTLANGDMLLM